MTGLAGAILQLQGTAGNRAVTEMIQRRVATRTLTRTAGKMDGVKTLTADVGSDDGLGWARGTNPAAGEPTRIKSVGPKSGRYVGGHMFNQTFGGLGTWENMIVQSEDSNKNMNLHDNILKRLGIKAGQKERFARNDPLEYGAHQTVSVQAPAPASKTNYRGEKYVPASVTVTITPFRRDPSNNTESPWPQSDHGEAIAASYVVTNVPPYPPAMARRGPTLTGIRKRTARVALNRLAGRHAHTLTVKQLTRVSGIGPAKALALYAYFRTNKVSLQSLIAQPPATPALGFGPTDIARLIHGKLQ